MAKIVQWYITKIETKSNFNNCFPWNDIDILKMVDEFKFGLIDDLIRQNFYGVHYYDKKVILPLKEHIVGYPADKLQFKIIGKDSYDEDDINIMPFALQMGKFDLLTDPKKFPFTNLKPKTLDWIKSHKDLIIVWLDFWEGKNFLNTAYDFIEGLVHQKYKYDLDNKQIFFLGIENINYQSEWLTISGHSPWLTMTYSDSFRKETKFKEFNPDYNVKKFESKLFGYFGLQRLSRYHLLKVLYDRIGKDNFWHTIGAGKELEVTDESQIYREFEMQFVKNTRYGDIHDADTVYKLKKNIDEYCQINVPAPRNNLPKDLQEPEKHYGKNPLAFQANCHHFDKTFLSIVSETNANRFGPEKGCLCFSEKVLKPIYAGRPFVVLAEGNYLRKLKEFGFKTFDMWWDESYDDPALTMPEAVDRIVDICDMVNKWDDGKIMNTFEEMKPILEHNRTLLEKYSKNQPLWIEKIEKLLDK